jgi:hypothetical protein
MGGGYRLNIVGRKVKAGGRFLPVTVNLYFAADYY